MNVTIRISLDTANRLSVLRQFENEDFDSVIRRRLLQVLPETPRRPVKAVIPVPPVTPPAPVSSSGYWVQLGAEKRAARTAVEAWLMTLGYLASYVTEFWPRLAPLVRGRSRNHLSQRRALVYPGQPHLDDQIVEVAPGWFIGTNISNREKQQILTAALDLAGPEVARNVHCDLSKRAG